MTSSETKSYQSPENLQHHLLWQYENNRSITTNWHYFFLIAYIFVGIVALMANGLVVLAVYRNKKVRTPRNLLIFHLAVTDLALAGTIPLSAIDALSKYWPWGKGTDWLCKISRSAPTTLVFMVSFIIIIIASDRYRCIVLRNHCQMTRSGAFMMLPLAFAISFLVSIPFGLHLQLIQPDVSISRLSDKLSNVTVLFCMEVWKSDDGKPDGKNLTHRGVFSLIVACLQYLLPLLIVLGIYGLIYRFLREQQYPRHLRQNKTNALLASISITHCIIWLPFSVFNILADLWPDTLFGNVDPETVISLYCAVHLIGLLSTCTNPVLYAFFNENLRKEFEFLADCLCPKLMRSRSRRSAAGIAAAAPNGTNKSGGKTIPTGGAVAVTREEYIIDDDNIELDPTFHKESEEDVCDCFKTPEDKQCFEMMNV